MTKVTRIDKRNRTKPEGYCILAGEGWLTVVQGGNGAYSNVIRLHGSELETFLADLDSAINQMASESLQRVS